MLRLLSVASLASALFVSVSRDAGAASVRLEKQADKVVVTIDGKPFTTYQTAPSQAKPYFWPVLAADGANVSRGLEKPPDHPHHKGIWCAIDEVNHIKFWAEEGKIANVSVDLLKAEGNPAQLRIVNHWLDTDQKPLLIEKANVSVYADRRIDYDIEFVAGDKPVTFGDTKEGLFGIRVADSLRGQSGGKITSAEGAKGEPETWGKESKWIDYVGQIDGKTYGIAIFDDPANFRKSRYHVRNYGLFTLSPFGQNAYTNGTLPADPVMLDPGKSLRLRYGLYVHEGDGAQGRVAEIYQDFVKAR